MKIFYFIISFLLLQNYLCVGQTQSGLNKIDSAKKEYIAKQLNLTKEESQQFWPVYNNYTKEVKQARVQYKDDNVAFDEKLVEIRKKYRGQFGTVLKSDARAKNVFNSEVKYKNALSNELKNRQKLRKQNGFQQKMQKRRP
ncbi:MAG TPA: hypothetical protein PL045_03245 [Chitinophagaceae bacterium]|nr:hypothetical protein [Chitinophagaceae bacterium]